MTDDGPLRPAAVTVAVAGVLFVAKLVVALASDSVGLLSTAIDSGLDLGMSLVVLGSIVLARRPADLDHPYGHGKFESVSGLFEAGVLAAVGVLVAYVGVQRIQDPRAVELTGWMVAVLVATMVVGAERGFSLAREGEEHESPALSVDAWHYASDVVTAGLGLLGAWLATQGYAWADGASAVVVGVFLAAGSVHVGREATADLVDRVPPTIVRRVEAAIDEVEDVEEVTQVRVRGAGPDVFVDATVEVPRAFDLERAHATMDDVEDAVEAEIGEADVTVHAEPVAGRESVATTLEVLASRDPAVLGVHEVFVDRLDEALVVDCHVEVDDELTLREAHAVAQRFEDAVKDAVASVTGVRTHIEPVPRHPREGETVTEEHPALADRIRAVLAESPFREQGPLEIKLVGGSLEAVVTARTDPDTSLYAAHQAADRLERDLLHRCAELERVVVHVEPEGEP